MGTNRTGKSSAIASALSERGPLAASRSIKIGSVLFLQKWLYSIEWVLVALLLAQIAYRTMPKAWHTLNSDFPNYYLSARLTREHYDTSRIYEWIWLQRQKDHRAIDQQTVGMVPITAFSTLVLYPFAGLPALVAKQCWIIVNVGLLLATVWLLHSLTAIPWRRILLIVALSLPLRVNLLLGQYYLLLLFLLTLACRFYVDQRRFRAGILIGISAGLKIFPIIYLLFFLRKRDWQAFTSGLLALFGCFGCSVLVFGWELNRTYITQVLSATFRGECLAPYNLQAASLSALLHRLFVFEPQLNPSPAVNLPWIFAVLHPVLMMAILAPSILLVVPGEYSTRRVQIEWAAVLLASLAISTSPASYLFTLLILPVVLVWKLLHEERKYTWTACLLVLYVAAGFLGGKTDSGNGWVALLGVPRLFVLIVLAFLSYLVLRRLVRQEESRFEPRSERTLWIVTLITVVAAGVVTSLKHQRGLYADYKWRISEPVRLLSSTHPAIQSDKTLFIALLSDGYHWATARGDTVTWSNKSEGDYLALTATNGEQWVEHVGEESAIRPIPATRDSSSQAELPVASYDGRRLAFLREDHGRARIWLRDLGSQSSSDRVITAPEFNVLEMSFLPDGSLVFAANADGYPSLFVAEQNRSVRSLGVKNARYPSVSPDGHWLVYSQSESGNWNLWLRDLSNGQTSRLTHAECNDMESAWMGDSQTIIYTSDCGRGLWLPALCRRRILP
jgi:Glycosyltransferase family 87/WD40-like Beta Propeller Repeat